MVIRMRIYNTKGGNPEADEVFYTLVKPVHERYGARFLGRYMDKKGRHVVMWGYSSEEDMKKIQLLVAEDPETLKNKDVRLNQGLHGTEFEELILYPTGHSPQADTL